MMYTLKTANGQVILERCTAKKGFEKIQEFQKIDRLTETFKPADHYILSPINK